MLYHEDILQHQDVNSMDQNSEQTALVDQQVIELLQRSTLKCPDCDNSMTTVVIGKHLARRMIVKCTNGYCPNK